MLIAKVGPFPKIGDEIFKEIIYHKKFNIKLCHSQLKELFPHIKTHLPFYFCIYDEAAPQRLCICVHKRGLRVKQHILFFRYTKIIPIFSDLRILSKNLGIYEKWVYVEIEQNESI